MNTPCVRSAKGEESKVVLLISLLAIVHVFCFSAAFPFFGIVDEQAHIDLSVRYSHGEIPRGISLLCPEAKPFFLIYGTPEYIWPPETQPGNIYPAPPWKQSFTNAASLVLSRYVAWKYDDNHEASQPPLYYGLAGAWWRIGKMFNLDGLALLYWLRFLNIPIVAALVWLGWLTARQVFPDRQFARLTVPALIAFMPQTSFFSINNDVLAPLTAGLFFLLFLKLWERPLPGTGLAAATGLALAAMFLTKSSLLPTLASAGAFLSLKFFQLVRREKILRLIPAFAALAFAALLPMLAWMLWCKTNYGDLTGAAIKIQRLGWTSKPPAEWLGHPLFSFHGLWVFVSGNVATFWQGEFLWQGRPLTNSAMDHFFELLTLSLLALSLVGASRRPSVGRIAFGFAYVGLAATAAFFALLSVKYDFHECFYPSREHPFFTSGRLFLGLLIPALILLAGGLDFMLQKCSRAAKFTLLMALLMFMLAGEATNDLCVFSCEYNWFHQ